MTTLSRAAVAALELTVTNLRTDLHMAASVLTIAARGLSRELATGTHAGCFAVVTDPPPARTTREVPASHPLPALSADVS